MSKFDELVARRSVSGMNAKIWVERDAVVARNVSAACVPVGRLDLPSGAIRRNGGDDRIINAGLVVFV